MNYKEIVDRLQAEIDEDTRQVVEARHNDVTIWLEGDWEGQFLRAVRRKGQKLGLEVISGVADGVEVIYPTVYDRETYDGEVDEECDIDGGALMTAVSQGVWEVLVASGLKQKDVCIVGRGPAVQRLGGFLLGIDHTVTICHSKTDRKALAEHLDRAEIVILGTPELPAGMTFSGAELIIDIGGAVDSAFAEACQNYLGPRDIGRLCTSILCNRAARWYL